MGEYQSGQMGQTVNLLVFTFGGSNPSSPTHRQRTVMVQLSIFFCTDFNDLSGDFCQVLSVTMPASLPLQLAKLILKYPKNLSHLNLNSFFNFRRVSSIRSAIPQ